MAQSSFVTTSFLGGEISQAAQGRLDLPAYRISLNVCLNFIPIESGALLRRPGTRHVAPARGGNRGRLIPFSFAQNFPYLMEFTDAFLRFTTGPALVMTNDAQAVVAISAANPAVVQTTSAHGWSTGNSVMFNSLGSNNPLLQNRQFTITFVDSTHFSIADAITGTSIDGLTLGSFVSGNVTRILEIATTYTNGSWSSLRSVQAETRTVLLNGVLPQVLQVATPPTATQFATFTLGPANFIDGPYLDPIANSTMTPSGGLNGVITLTLGFAAYDSTVAYNIGDFVTSSGISYQSLTALNQGNTPVSSPSNWKTVNGGAAVNNGLGFQPSDVGRLIRLFSEPPLWSSASTYTTGNVVAYSDGNGGFQYWTALKALSSAPTPQPGTDATSWAINATGAQWTWGQITAASGSGLITPATAIGNMTGGGGLSAAFNGTTSQLYSASADLSANITTYPVWSSGNYAGGTKVQYNGVGYQATIQIYTSNPGYPWWNSYTNYPALTIVGDPFDGNIYQANVFVGTGQPAPDGNGNWSKIANVTSSPPAGNAAWTNLGAMSQPTEDTYVGQHYGSAQSVQSVTIYPSTDLGLCNSSSTFTLNLRASNSAPSSGSSGTLLGTSGAISNTTSPVTITSSDTVSTFAYLWVEYVAKYSQPLPDNGSHVFTAKLSAGQVQFFAPTTSNGSVITAQIRGGALLYNSAIRTWRNGVYSGFTGYPTCGTYHEGRIWFGGVVSNRFDASVSNGLVGTQLNFAPTSPGGAVASNNAISYVCNGEEVNQILWMKPDQQGILFATQVGPWLISGPAQGALSPSNIKAVRVSGPGAANIEPRRTEHTLTYVHRFTRKVMEYFADVFSGKFSAPNLSERAKHLTVSGIAEIAYQQELAPIIWARRNDGGLIGATYKRDTLTTSQGPTIIGWHRHQLGSGRLVESLSVGPSQNGNLDTTSMVTNDPNTGIRHIELMADLLDEGFALTDCWFLDDAIVPTSTVVQAAPTGGTYGSLLVNGLWAHNGKIVTAFIAGLDCGDYTVSSGSITVPFGDGVSNGTGNGLFTASLVNSFATLPAVVGFTYVSQGQLVRPVTQADTGAQAGPGFAKLGRQHRAGALLYGAVNGSISFGTDFKRLDPIKLRYANEVPYPVNVQWSGIWRDNIDSRLDFDSQIAWQISRPLPGFFMAVGGFDSKADV